jgi:cell division protein ZapA (FtsZ GTPase activity inhibitor)
MSPAADSRKHTYRVRIFNQTYSITSSASEAEFQQIADYVDHLMHTIASRSGSADSTRAAVMAAMHLADKLRQSEQRLQTLAVEQHQALAQVEEQTGYLERLLRETLEMDDLPDPVAVLPVGDGSPEEPVPAEKATLSSGRVERVPAPLRLPHREEQAESAEATESEAASRADIAEAGTVRRTRGRRERDDSAPTLFPMEDPAE